ncbi:MAG: hypothetical protein KTR29_16835 [Rhodothermaceae bacterium]|nr:hypothetical protein [Rhodothermaceae bacterium]
MFVLKRAEAKYEASNYAATATPLAFSTLVVFLADGVLLAVVALRGVEAFFAVVFLGVEVFFAVVFRGVEAFFAVVAFLGVEAFFAVVFLGVEAFFAVVFLGVEVFFAVVAFLGVVVFFGFAVRLEDAVVFAAVLVWAAARFLATFALEAVVALLVLREVVFFLDVLFVALGILAYRPISSDFWPAFSLPNALLITKKPFARVRPCSRNFF